MYQDDSKLVQACLRGKQAAWDELVDRYARLVYSIALRHGMTRMDADDIVQDVFTLVYRRLDSLRNRKLLAAWIITITLRECWREHRCGPEWVELNETLMDRGAMPHEEVEFWESRYLVHLALERLEPRCRELLKALFFQPDKPNYQILSAQFKIPPGSIGPMRARCFKKLETVLAETGIDFAPTHRDMANEAFTIQTLPKLGVD